MVFGKFTTESPQQKTLSIKTIDNIIIVDGAMSIRDLNDKYNLNIVAYDNAKTINGLVINILNCIPNIGVCFKIDNMIFEIISMGHYWVERVKITLI
jgi:Mg2+/Co2+ transporter CorB